MVLLFYNNNTKLKKNLNTNNTQNLNATFPLYMYGGSGNLWRSYANIRAETYVNLRTIREDKGRFIVRPMNQLYLNQTI